MIHGNVCFGAHLHPPDSQQEEEGEVEREEEIVVKTMMFTAGSDVTSCREPIVTSLPSRSLIHRCTNWPKLIATFWTLRGKLVSPVKGGQH